MNIYGISGLINAITFFALGVFVYFRGSGKVINKKHCLFCLFTGFWSYSYFLWIISQDAQTALFYCRTLMAWAIFIPVSFLDFTLAFINKYHKNRKILHFGYFLFGLFFLLNFTPAIVKEASPALFFKFWPKPGPIFTPFLIIWLFYWLYSSYLLFKEYRTANGVKRNQIKYVLIAIAIGYLGGSTNYFLWYNIPIPPIGNFVIPSFAIIMTYAIVRHNLLDINIVFRKTLIYSFIIGFLFTVSVVTLFILVQYFGGFFPQKTFWLTLLLVIILSLLFQPVHRRSTSLVDRIFFKGTLPKIAAELKQAEKLATLGVLASGLAHEIKNPLAPIKTYIQNLPDNLTNPNYIYKITKIIPEEVDKITDIINQLRDFAQPPPLNISKINIHRLIDKRLNLLEQELSSRNITVEKQYSPAIPEINADPIQLERVFINLFLNAIDAMPNGGKLTIATETISDNSISIKVQDTGIGIEKEDLPHIFDPFYSKGKYKGTGLGLAITHRIICEHKGKIQVQSSEGKGASFYVYLPIGG